MDNYNLVGLLYHAAQGRYLDVQALVHEGVDLDVQDPNGRTPLMLAAKNSHQEVADLLINSGANIHCCDDNGWTLLHHASYEGWVGMVQCLVNEGVDLEMKDSCGRTPMMLAADESHVEVVDLLLNSGADVHCCDDYGWTMLHHASRGNSVEIVQFLLNKGVALEKKDPGGETALMVAAQRSTKEVVELLINSGADVHSYDNSGWSLLHYAASGGSVEAVQCILNKGVALDTKSCLETPLHLAVVRETAEVADYLLKLGSDCNLENNKGESPFTLLIELNEYIETIKLCIEKGAYVKPIDYNRLLEDPTLKKVILQDVKLCSQAVINKFNNRDLPLVYNVSAQKLPPICKMKIRNESGMALEVEQAVTHEIKTKGLCNLLEMVPLVLGMLCVKSIEKSRLAFNRVSPLESQKGLKRSRCCNNRKYPCKKAIK